MTVEIRPARPADAPEMVRVLRASITELCGLDHGHHPERLAAWLGNKTVDGVAGWVADPANVLLVARLDGVLAGVGGLRVESTRTALGFYRAVGFGEDGPPATKHGFTTHPLRKSL